MDKPIGTQPAGAWLFAAFLTACYALSIIDRQVIAFVAIDIKRDLAISDFELGMVQGFAFSMFYALAGVPLGWAVDRLQRTRVLGAALLTWSASTILCGFAGSFHSLAAARVGVGAGEAALTPGAYSLLGDLFSKRRFPIASMIYSLGAPIAIALAAALSAFMLGAAENGRIALPLVGDMAAWRAIFLVAGLPGIVFAAVFFMLREPARKQAGAAADTGETEDLLPFLRAHWRIHGGYALASMLTVVLYYCFNAWNPAILARNFGWTPGQIGASLGTIGLASGVAGCLLGGLLTARLMAHRPASGLWILTGGVLVSALCGVAASQVQTGGAYVAVAAVAAAATSLLLMVSPVLLQMITPPPLRGRITALFMLINVGIGAGAGPTLVGAFSSFVFSPDHLPQALGTVVAGIGTIAAVGFAALFRPMLRAAQKQAE